MNNPHKIKGTIFDHNQQIIVVDNIEIFVTELSDELLVNTFKNTIEQHILMVIQEKLVENNMMKKLKGGEYKSGPTESALVCMMEEIKARFEDIHEGYYENELLDKIDFTPITEIPDSLDFLNDVESRLIKLNLIPKKL